jgi:hypothetical protein
MRTTAVGGAVSAERHARATCFGSIAMVGGSETVTENRRATQEQPLTARITNKYVPAFEGIPEK